MEYGSKEWIAAVNENYKFPAVMAFYLTNKERSILSKEIDTDYYEDDVEYSKIEPNGSFDDGEVTALLSVNLVHDAEDYYNITKDLKKKWGA
jgi:hypothetical protein